MSCGKSPKFFPKRFMPPTWTAFFSTPIFSDKYGFLQRSKSRSRKFTNDKKLLFNVVCEALIFQFVIKPNCVCPIGQ